MIYNSVYMRKLYQGRSLLSRFLCYAYNFYDYSFSFSNSIGITKIGKHIKREKSCDKK